MTPTKKFIQEKAKKPKIAYIITDKYFPDLEVVDSSNAWWLSRGKTERLISAFKIDSSVMEACVYAGITLDQYKYFCQVHASFSTIKQLCSELPCLQARQEVVKGIKDDKEFSLKYLERKKKKEFGLKGDFDELTENGFNLKIEIFKNEGNKMDSNSKTK